MNDGDDCNQNCEDATCLELYTYWVYVTDGESINAANYSVVCNDWIPNKLIKFSEALSFDSTTCMLAIELLDFNGDGYINFREFSTWTNIIAYSQSVGYGVDKGINLNCSSCVGLDVYNVDMSLV